MWHKNEGKMSPEKSQQPAGGTTKPQVVAEPPAAPSISPAPVDTAPIPAPLVAPPEPPAVVTPAATGTSRIQAGLKVHGEISGNSDLFIDGELQGKIRLGGARVVIGPSGKVQADIEASAVTIEGSVQGNIKASEGVRLGPGSRVQGSIVTPRIGIEDGARLRGKVEMVKADSSAGSASAASTAAKAIRSAEPGAARPLAASATAE
jgi:cytoskeletal protein CcmA (bactofilin family)